MHIDFLADQPEAITALAPPLLEHWRFAFPEETLEMRVEKLRRHLNRETLPLAWVAHDAGEVYGTAALRTCDLQGQEDLTPWLGGVFVLPAFRRRGICAALCKTVERHAARAGFPQIYLFTIDQQKLYAALGWRPLKSAVWRGIDADIMVRTLGTR